MFSSCEGFRYQVDQKPNPHAASSCRGLCGFVVVMLVIVVVTVVTVVWQQTARQMPGMSGRESDGGRRSESKNDGSTVSDGYSSKSVTTTNGVR